MLNPLMRRWLAAGVAALLGACGNGEPSAPTQASSGQVQAAAAPQVGFYAASRFAEQASFGPTPALIAEIQALGFERWIDAQLALPVSQTDPTKYTAWQMQTITFKDVHHPMQAEQHRLWLTARDQLRERVTWALSQVIVVSIQRVDPAMVGIWSNSLRRLSLGNYADLLYGISTHAAMGFYLDNAVNRPRSAECPNCAPNENFARELLQLFSIGVVKLNADGSEQRQANGRPVETYSQRDVDELARVLTGWRFTPKPQPSPFERDRDWTNVTQPMVPTTFAPHRDSGAKTVMGRSFAAGRSAEQDLRDAIAMLMAHPNIAPFVSLRLIQHLVKSDPTPAYLSRVAGVFRNNGQGVVGDMKAVVKAVLLDPEARAGDTPGRGARGDGKVREPVLFNLGLQRGLGCQRALTEPWSNGPMLANQQEPYNPQTVFSFYAPTDRSPGRNVLAPEQRLITAAEFRHRLWQFQNNMIHSWEKQGFDSARAQFMQRLRDAGCSIDDLVALYRTAPDQLPDALGRRWFRGALPAELRRELVTLAAAWKLRNNWADEEIVVRLITMALMHPAYGAML